MHTMPSRSLVLVIAGLGAAALASPALVAQGAGSSARPSAPAAATAPAPRPPAPTLTRPSSAIRPVDARGFIHRWLVLEPLKVPGQLTEEAVRTAGRAAEDADETRSTSAERQPAKWPADGDQVSSTDGALIWHAVDTTRYNVNLYHFAYALGKPTSNVLFRAATTVIAPREMTNVRLAIGSNAASIWYLNGAEVVSLFNDRQAVVDDGVSRRVTLKAGANVIRAVVINAGGATDFCARFLDANDRPITTLTTSLAGPR